MFKRKQKSIEETEKKPLTKRQQERMEKDRVTVADGRQQKAQSHESYEDTESVPHDSRGGRFSRGKMIAIYREDFAYLIRMEMRNGLGREFVVSAPEGHFVFNKSRYLIDSALKTWITDSKIYALDYVEGYCLPIKRAIVNDIKDAVAGSNVIDVELATNPKVLEEFIESKVSEGIMKGQQIDEWLRSMRVWIVIGTMTIVANTLLFMYKTGMFSKVAGTLPGMG